MEWLLRSASEQLPLHDLGQEKDIVRKRMAELQTKLKGYGVLGNWPLTTPWDAVTWRCMKYPQALSELQLAIQSGNQSAEVHYALGFVLGKHFEQAIYEARLCWRRHWVKKQPQDIEPKYLTRAIASLERSRSLESGHPSVSGSADLTTRGITMQPSSRRKVHSVKRHGCAKRPNSRGCSSGASGGRAEQWRLRRG